jgi:hypothetical protein
MFDLQEGLKTHEFDLKKGFLKLILKNEIFLFSNFIKTEKVGYENVA